jgi:vacuolar-type H+-ATPase subunit I/STV1
MNNFFTIEQLKDTALMHISSLNEKVQKLESEHFEDSTNKLVRIANILPKIVDILTQLESLEAALEEKSSKEEVDEEAIQADLRLISDCLDNIFDEDKNTTILKTVGGAKDTSKDPS